jgi:hypothetical protein
MVTHRVGAAEKEEQPEEMGLRSKTSLQGEGVVACLPSGPEGLRTFIDTLSRIGNSHDVEQCFA